MDVGELHMSDPFSYQTTWAGAARQYKELLPPGFDPKVIVELGVHGGFSFFTFARDFPEATVYGFDNWAHRNSDPARKHLSEHIGSFPNAVFHDMASRDARKWWRKKPTGKEEPIDLLHIDADHRYEAVGEDYRFWRSLVRPGGVILFHDIFLGTKGVARLFSEIHGEKAERDAGGFGLGALYIPEEA